MTHVSWHTLQAGEPRVLDNRMQLQLVASEPAIVTPIGMAFDQRGRLLVIESHTHFPKEDYAGPPHDRIRILEDTDGDGAADRIRSFLEGTRKTMSIAAGPDGWIYIATRMKVVRVRDTNNDDVADEEQSIVSLDTPGDYPHNGLCGLCLDGQGGLYFGLGENLGAEYRLIGSDGVTLSGGGEGGNIYRCRLDGAQLGRIATGFWNPFGICLDSRGRLFTVGNDPDSSPPCRLVHVVRGGDYGFQFRYGRSGRHPLQAWDGELPGTLPMVAGTSEAPSDVVPWHGWLWVSSWGEYRVERYRLKHRGASVAADRDVVVQGDDQFRPVDFAVGPDGALYFSDWVDRSYNVHGKGRIWRLSWKQDVPAGDFPALSDLERQARQIENATVVDSGQPTDALLAALASADVFLHQAAVSGLSRDDVVNTLDWDSLPDAGQRRGLLSAARMHGVSTERRSALLQSALRDSSVDVRLTAVRWIADERLTDFRAALNDILVSDVMSLKLFQAALAASEWLDTGSAKGGSKPVAGEEYLVAALTAADSPPAVQVLALQSLPVNHAQMAPERLVALATRAASTAVVKQEAVRSLVAAESQQRSATCANVAMNPQLPVAARADAVAGLNPADEGDRRTLSQLLESESDAVRAAARDAITLSQAATVVNLVPASLQPAVDDTDGWLKSLQQAGSAASAETGWRVFFGQHAARCANCHRVNGRGVDVGPDLTDIARRMGSRRVLESILQPGREMAPQYVPWTIELRSGRVFSAVSLGVPGSGPTEQFLTTDGRRLDISRDDIESRTPATQSIMPEHLGRMLSPAQLQSLLLLLGGTAGDAGGR